ncbi:hypothetical protein AB4144_52865, partial [Rhizobiaceae sp. 2RAB30]
LRPVGNPLHGDSLAMGIDAPDGITTYGWAPQARTAHGWIFGPWWSPLSEVGTAEHAEQRRIDPPRFSLPYFRISGRAPRFGEGSSRVGERARRSLRIAAAWHCRDLENSCLSDLNPPKQRMLDACGRLP